MRESISIIVRKKNEARQVHVQKGEVLAILRQVVKYKERWSDKKESPTRFTFPIGSNLVTNTINRGRY